jgi:hypothetical protein
MDLMRVAGPTSPRSRRNSPPARRVGAAQVTADLRRIEQNLHRQEQLLARFEALGGSGVEGEARSLMRSLGLRIRLHPAHERAQRRPAQARRASRRVRSSAPNSLLDEPETHLTRRTASN